MSETVAQKWLEKAGEDLIVAKLVLNEGHLSHACFLSQQTIEKSFKGILIAKTGHHPRTHKLVDLLQLCLAHEKELTQFHAECISVDQFYIPVRYPDGVPGGLPDGQPNLAQATKALESAENIHTFVVNYLGDLGASSHAQQKSTDNSG